MAQALVIDYYSDALCLWTWIAPRRIEELLKILIVAFSLIITMSTFLVT
jgi:predicted DsbA family dithiol-disulfide isomerase